MSARASRSFSAKELSACVGASNRLPRVLGFSKRAKQHLRSSRFLAGWQLWFDLFATVALVVLLSGCPKNTPVAETPPPPPPAPVSASLQASPASIKAGEESVITWKTENATDVTIEPLGTVEASGSKNVTPAESTTYRLVAKGPGGSQESIARVTVLAAAATATTPVMEEDLLGPEGGRQDIFFDYDDYSIASTELDTISNDAHFMKEHPDMHIVVEGHCDEHGSVEYNLALGDNRANEVKSALVKAGVSADRIATISYGKEKPFCMDSTDACWKQNRRAHIVAQKENEAVSQ